MSKNKIFKATFIIMVVTVITRFLGLVRDVLVASNFGVGVESNAYIAAVSVPDAIFGIIGLAISTTFIPMLSEIKNKQGKEKMFEFSNNIITIISIICIILSLFGFLFTEEVVKLFVTGFDSETKALTVFLTKVSMINILFLCLKACFISMLQVCEDFVMPSILGLFFNAPIILYLAIFTPVSVVGLTIANVIGNILSVLVQIPSLYKHGFRIKPFINLKDERIRRTLILILPVIIGAGANSLNMIVDKNIASLVFSNGVSILDYGQKLIIFTNVAITTSIVSVMYPLMANKLNSGDGKGFLEYLSKSIVVIALFLVPIMMGFVFLRVEIINLIWVHGEFNDPQAILLTTTVFAAYALQLPFFGARDVLNSSLFSMQKTKVTTINGVIGVFTNIILSIILSKYMGVVGIAIASSIAACVTAVLLFNSTRKLIGGFNARPMIIKIMKIILASSIMIVVLYVINKLIGINNEFIILAINGIIGVIVFGVVCKLIKIEEFDEAVEMITKKVRKS